MKHIRRALALILAFILLTLQCGIALSDTAQVVLPSQVTIIEEDAFYGDTSLDKVVLPDGVTEIRARAFLNSSLSEIYLPGSIKFIDDTAFDGPENVSVTAEKGTYAYDWAIDEGYILPEPTPTPTPVPFEYEMNDGKCTITRYIGSEETVAIPDSIADNPVVKIGDQAFDGCSDIQKISIPYTVGTIGVQAFNNCSGLTDISLAYGVTEILDNAFCGCSSVESILIPASVTNMGKTVFGNCTSLKDVVLPNSITSMGDFAFTNCSSLRNITIPESVTTIGEFTFYNSGVIRLYIPDSVTSIGQFAFAKCEYLGYVVIPASVTTIDMAIFNQTSIGAVYVKTGSTAEQYCKTNSIRYRVEEPPTAVPAPAPVFTDGDFTYAFENGTATITAYSGNALKLIIPATMKGYPVTGIGDSAFSNNGYLRSVEIPDSVKSIGNNSFENCSGLKSISIPRYVEQIGDGAFANCGEITAYVISRSYALKYCINNSITYIAAPSVEAGMIVSPIDGATVEIFKTGQMNLTFTIVYEATKYLVEIEEAGTIVFSHTFGASNDDNDEMTVYITPYDMPFYTADMRQTDHTVTITVSAIIPE